MDYKVLYEISYFNIIISKLLSIYTIIGIFLLIAVIFYTLHNIIFKTEKFTLSMIVRLIVMLIVGGIFFLEGVLTFNDSAVLYKNYKNGDYSVVEGTVEEFSPIEKDGKGSEDFKINDVIFMINSSSLGYNKTKISEGVIKGNGQKLRIYYKLRISEEYKNDPEYFDFENEYEVFESKCKENIILKIEEIE